eukprot:COSAG03_NODE_78_length_14126_cov_12.984886_3_plen_185_part_00
MCITVCIACVFFLNQNPLRIATVAITPVSTQYTRLDFGRSSRSDGGKKWLAEAAIRRCHWRLPRRTAVAGGFCKRANRRGMVVDGYVSAAHPLFVAAADRLRHAERALSHHAQPPSTDATSTPPRLCCRPRRSRCRPRSGASHTHSAHVCQHRCLGHATGLRGAGRRGDAGARRSENLGHEWAT